MKLVTVGAVGVLALAGAFFLLQRVDGGLSDASAERACRVAVLDRLKAPASAQWPERATFQRIEGTVVVSGKVDSQNDFGALKRLSFSCDVGPDGNVDDIVIDE
jgi:hypothetical protein